MVRKIAQTLYVLTIGGVTAARAYLEDRTERKLVARFRLSDIKSLGDQAVLANIVRHHWDHHVASAAASCLTNQRRLEFFANDASLDHEVRVACIRQLADQHVLVQIALRSRNVLLAQAAAERVTESWGFHELMRSPMITVRSIAAMNCRDPEILFDYFSDEDERVRDFAETSLAEIGIDPRTRAAAGAA